MRTSSVHNKETFASMNAETWHYPTERSGSSHTKICNGSVDFLPTSTYQPNADICSPAPAIKTFTLSSDTKISSVQDSHSIEGNIELPTSSGRTKEFMVRWATEGWKKEPSLGALTSPFGIIGKTKGSVIMAGVQLLELYKWLMAEYDLPWYAAGAAVVFGLFVTVIGGMIFLIWFLSDKDKMD